MSKKAQKQIELAKLKQAFSFMLEDRCRKRGCPIVDPDLFLKDFDNTEIFNEFKKSWCGAYGCPPLLSQKKAFKRIRELKALIRENITQINKLCNEPIFEVYMYADDVKLKRFKIRELLLFEEILYMQEYAYDADCLDKARLYIQDLLMSKKVRYFYSKSDAEKYVKDL